MRDAVENNSPQVLNSPNFWHFGLLQFNLVSGLEFAMSFAKFHIRVAGTRSAISIRCAGNITINGNGTRNWR